MQMCGVGIHLKYTCFAMRLLEMKLNSHLSAASQNHPLLNKRHGRKDLLAIETLEQQFSTDVNSHYSIVSTAEHGVSCTAFSRISAAPALSHYNSSFIIKIGCESFYCFNTS